MNKDPLHPIILSLIVVGIILPAGWAKIIITIIVVVLALIQFIYFS